jgi:hypothetical protein
MAEGKVHEGEQIVELSATEDLARDRMAVDSVLFEGSAAGTFVFQFGHVSFSVYNVSPLFGRQIVFNRSTNYVKLTSGPTAAKAYVFLEKKR